MRLRMICARKALALVPLLGVFNLVSCQADAIRGLADDLQRRADRIEDQDDDVDLGDLLSDLVEDL